MDADPDGSLLRFITCGIDDGKSTLIGRLLVDADVVPDHRRAAAPDLAGLVDGLQAEREQGITIDVGYRYFSTPRRRFIVADTPGHEQYTRNMATGASTGDLAVILVDADQGPAAADFRHSAIVALMGIRRIVLAVNKMDLVGHREDRFAAIVEGYTAMAGQLGLRDVMAIPVLALHGDNVMRPSAAMPWYRGPTLLGHLEAVPSAPVEDQPFRLAGAVGQPPTPAFRGYAGTVGARPGATGRPAGGPARTGRCSRDRPDRHHGRRPGRSPKPAAP